ncbi:hypothetical protein [Pseudomonas sp. CGJS7]|uniref:hypothetical protein n=1 Tax=Pseudomonas sp. CGJS7 TaxID=3109348 RepID=UPI00300BBF12
MPTRIFGDKNTLQFQIAAKDPGSEQMRCVDIHAADTHLTANDNAVYVPAFLFLLHRDLKSFRNGARFQPRPDVFGDLAPERIHSIFADDSEQAPDTGNLSDLWGFLNLGDTTLHLLSFLIPTRDRLYLTVDMHRPDEAALEIRAVEVSAEALQQTLLDTFEVVAAEYPGEKSHLS